MRRLVLLTATAAVIAGCGASEEDDVRAAMERAGAAFRHGDNATWCRSIVPDTVLPDPVLRRIPVEGGGSDPLRDLDDLRRECTKGRPLDDVSRRERARAPTDVPDEVRILDLEPTQGVERVALVGSGRDATPLVRIGDEWLLVFDTR